MGAAQSEDSTGKRPALILLWQGRGKSRPDELGARGGGVGPDAPQERGLFWSRFNSCSRGLCSRGRTPEFTGTEGRNMHARGKCIAAVSVSVDSCSQARPKYHQANQGKESALFFPPSWGITADTCNEKPAPDYTCSAFYLSPFLCSKPRGT